MIVMGVDPGTTNLGVAFIDVSTDNDFAIRSIYSKTLSVHHKYQETYPQIKPVSKLSSADRVVYIMQSLTDQINERCPDAIVIETPFMDRFKPTAFGPLSITFDKLNTLLNHVSNAPILHFAPTKIKSTVGVKAKKYKGKDKVLKALKDIPDIAAKAELDNISNDEVDAIAIAFTYIKLLRDLYNE